MNVKGKRRNVRVTVVSDDHYLSPLTLFKMLSSF